MTGRKRVQVQQSLREAEGYLELGMPQHALAALDRLESPGTFLGKSLYLRGEALRAMERFREAIGPLAEAADLAPSNVPAWLALGWCHKRVGRLDLAIESLEEAIDVEPGNALILYNLACYWSLAGVKRHALNYLAAALERDEKYRDLVPTETDFDSLRSDPDFQELTSIIV